MMGGPGSGRRNARKVGGRYAKATPPGPYRNLPYGDEGGLSRVILEPWRARCLAVEDTATADAIASALASRTWQWHNPYDGWPYTMYDPAFSAAYLQNGTAP